MFKFNTLISGFQEGVANENPLSSPLDICPDYCRFYRGSSGKFIFSFWGHSPLFLTAFFLIGFVYRVIYWASSPVPFRIPTTSGQAKSLPWIKQNKLESPSTLPQVLGRMALEVFLFRSLFRNTKAELQGSNLTYWSNKWLWLGGIGIPLGSAFYYSETLPAFSRTCSRIDPSS